MIELPKFKKYMNNIAFTDWVKFIINPKVIVELEKKMKAQGLDSDTIHKITDISIDEINNL